MKDSEGNEIPGSGEGVTLTKEEYTKLTEAVAESKQAVVNMSEEIKDLRKKNQEISKGNSPESVQPEEVTKIVEHEFKKREAQELEKVKESVLARFLDSHPEFSKEEDKDGLNFAAFQKALVRINLNGVKTEKDYTQVLEDALRLTVKDDGMNTQNDFSSTPASTWPAPSVKKYTGLSEKEMKLIQNNFHGDTEAYLKLKAKRPTYVEELLQWVR